MEEAVSTVLPAMVPPRGLRLVVVGGCGGIGRVLVSAALEVGLDVAVVDLAQSIREFPPPADAFAVACDATDESSVAAAFTELNQRWGAIDHLVNLVGFTKERSPRTSAQSSRG